MIVLDASAFLTFLLKEESDIIDPTVIEKMLLQEADIVVPPIFYTEVLNALLMAVKRKRISRVQLEEYITITEAMPFHIEDSITIEEIANLALDHSLTSYDASYVALALEYRVPVISMDKAIQRVCQKLSLT